MSYTIEQLDAAVASAVAECMEARRTLLVTLDEMRAEENASYELIARQGDLLTGVVNALRGEPPPDTSWSHHDAPELARKAVIRIAGLEALLKGINDTDVDRATAAFAQRGGQATSDAKKRTARENGRRGGRPKK